MRPAKTVRKVLLGLAAVAVTFGHAELARGESLVSSFKVIADNGQRIDVYGFPKEVLVQTSAYRTSVSYGVRGHVTRQRVRADLEGFGTIDMRFEPTGSDTATGVAGCTGRIVRRRGRFVGSFVLNSGDTTVQVDSARGTVMTDNLRCPRPPTVAYADPIGGGKGRRGVALLANTPYYESYLDVSALDGKRLRRFDFSTSRQVGAVSLYEAVYMRAPANSFRFNQRAQTATVSPPAPFSGQAVYRGRAAAPENRWTGDLTVELPVSGAFTLTGPTWAAELSGFTEIRLNRAAPAWVRRGERAARRVAR